MSKHDLPSIAIGADHAGVHLKDHLAHWLRQRGHKLLDKGTMGDASCDYPDFARDVAQAVVEGRTELGVLVCGTGQGMAMTANRVPGIRAAVVLDTFSAAAAREHNDANVLCLGARVCGSGLAEACLLAWLTASFEGGRHARRLAAMVAVGKGGGAQVGEG